MSNQNRRPHRRRAVTNWLAWLGGADRKILKRAPTARARFVQMALVLLSTAGLAVASMTFALADGVKVPLAVAIPCALAWGFIILNLDRFLVLSMGAIRDWRQLILMALPRLLMAMVLAAVISTPLVLRVFKHDIGIELVEQQQQRSARLAEGAARSKEQLEANSVQTQIDAYERVLAGHLPTDVSSPALETASAKAKTVASETRRAKQDRDKAYEAWQCELYGAGPKCHDASKRKGAGPLAAAKEREFREAEEALSRAQARLTDAETDRDAEEEKLKTSQAHVLERKRKEANQQLPALRQRLADLKATLEKASDDATKRNAADDGVLAQLRALSAASEGDSTLQWAHRLVSALLFLIEILPVAVKLLLNLGPQSAYEVEAQLEEERLKDRAKIRRAEARHIAERKSQTRIKVEEHMRELEERIGRQANDHVAGEMETIVDAALAKWSQDVQDQLANTYANGNGTGHANSNGNGHNGSRSQGRGRFRRRGHGDPTDGYAMPSADEL
jgi:hypothetical protein